MPLKKERKEKKAKSDTDEWWCDDKLKRGHESRGVASPHIKYKNIEINNNNKEGKTWLGLFFIFPTTTLVFAFTFISCVCHSDFLYGTRILFIYLIPLGPTSTCNLLFNSSTSMTFSPRPTFVILRHGWIMHACWFFIGLFS